MITNTSPKILVIEEDTDIREVLIELFESEGLAVMSATNGEEGLARLRDTNVAASLVLLDMLKGKMTSEKFMAIKAADPAIAKVPVILLSAGSKLAETANQLGATNYLAKPMKIQDLLGMVERYAGVKSLN